MRYANRVQAAFALIDKLSAYRATNPLVLALTRGAVPMAQTIATNLGGELDAAIARELARESDPDVALGSVSEFGDVFVDEAARRLGLAGDEIASLATEQIAKMSETRRLYSPLMAAADPRGRVVIVVDDGDGPGSSIVVTLRSARARGAREVVFATPVASFDEAVAIEAEADEVVMLATPEEFHGARSQYEEFEEITEDDVVRALSESRKMAPRIGAIARHEDLQPIEAPDSHPSATP